jgi:hypothetical protein
MVSTATTAESNTQWNQRLPDDVWAAMTDRAQHLRIDAVALLNEQSRSGDANRTPFTIDMEQNEEDDGVDTRFNNVVIHARSLLEANILWGDYVESNDGAREIFLDFYDATFWEFLALRLIGTVTGAAMLNHDITPDVWSAVPMHGGALVTLCCGDDR